MVNLRLLVFQRTNSGLAGKLLVDIAFKENEK